MDKYDIIVRPLVTEQGMHLANKRNAYSFEVHPKSNKFQIRCAVEQLYSVKVLKVRTANIKGKPRRRGRFIGLTKHWKKAVVVLHEDHRIDLF